MAGFSVLSVGISGLQAAQGGLETASHNIANASTPGYNRQRTLQRAITPQFTGAGFLGKGAEIVNVERLYSGFLSGLVRTSQTRFSELDTYATEIRQIDDLLSDPVVGLSPAVTGLVEGINEVATNPSSVPARQSLISKIQSMVSRFNDLDLRMSELYNGVNDQLISEVTLVNTIAREISEINDRVAEAENAGDRLPANDLRDQRDLLVNELNKHIKAEFLVQSDGSFSVFIGNGQPLVLSGTSYKITAAKAPNDASRIDIGILTPIGQAVSFPETLLSGGSIGGLLAFRRDALEPTQGGLGRLAVAIATGVNVQNRLGQDLTGAAGGNLFKAPTPLVSPDTRNPAALLGAGAILVSVAEFPSLTTSDYLLTKTATGYNLTRSADNVILFSNSTLPKTVDGLTFREDGTPAVGSSFKIIPTRNAARDIGISVTDTRSIAAAVPVSAAASIDNTGTGKISAGALIPPMVLTFDNNAPGYIGFPAGSTVSVFNGTTTTTTAVTAISQPVTLPAGSNVTVNGITFRITGVPANGDVFAVGPNQLAGGALNTGTVALGAGGTLASTTLTFADLTDPVPANPSGLRGFAVGSSVTVTSAAGVATTYKMDLSNETVPYTTGDTFAYNGMTFTLTGAPTNGDTFTMGATLTSVVNAGPATITSMPLPSNSSLAATTLSYDGANLSGFAAGTVTVTTTVAGITSTTSTAIAGVGTLVPYTPAAAPDDKATIVFTSAAAPTTTFGFILTGTPGAGDTFTFSRPPTVGGANAGTGAITQAVTPFTASLPTSTYTLTYDKANNKLYGFPPGTTVNVILAGATTASATQITGPTSGITYTNGMSIRINGVSLTFQGTINEGDKFTVGPTPAGTADNRNAVLLSGLQTRKSLLGGTATFEEAYAQLVSYVGNKAREANVSSQSQQTQLTQATSAEQSFSGVNLDEEGGNLLRFQQAYQAAAKVIDIASKLFDELVSLGR